MNMDQLRKDKSSIEEIWKQYQESNAERQADMNVSNYHHPSNYNHSNKHSSDNSKISKPADGTSSLQSKGLRKSVKLKMGQQQLKIATSSHAFEVAARSPEGQEL